MPGGKSGRARCWAAGAVDPGRRRPGQERGAADQPAASAAWGPSEEPAWATAWGDSAVRGRSPRDTPASEQVMLRKGAGLRATRQLPKPWASRVTSHSFWLLGFPDGCSQSNGRCLSCPGGWRSRVGATASADPAVSPTLSNWEALGGGGQEMFADRSGAGGGEEDQGRGRCWSGSRAGVGRWPVGARRWRPGVPRTRSEGGENCRSFRTLCHYPAADRVCRNPTSKSSSGLWERNLYFSRRAF